MMHFTFKTSSGYTVTVSAPDPDRARCMAKKKAGDNWHPSARLTAVTNAL